MVAVWALWAVSAVFLVASLATARPGGANDLISAATLDLAALSFVTVGAILVSRLPRNLIGWLLATGGFCFALGNGATGLAAHGLIADPGSLSGAVWFAWLSQWIWAPSFGAIVVMVLVYPSGRLLSARWRPVALATVVVISVVSFGSAVGPWPAGMFPVPNPLQLVGGAPGPIDALSVVAGPIVVLVVLLAVASLVIRYRRAVGIERAQLKWFVAVVAISVPAFLVGAFLYGDDGVALIIAHVADLIAFCGFALLPVAIGIAVLRYRLYEIDRLISRTISYGVITLVLASVFVVVVLAAQAVLGPLTGSSTIAVAGSTLLVAALFQPIRRRVQRLVDRRFNRTRYDAERTVAAFAARLRDEVDLQQLRAEILANVAHTVEPSSVSLWLRE